MRFPVPNSTSFNDFEIFASGNWDGDKNNELKIQCDKLDANNPLLSVNIFASGNWDGDKKIEFENSK